MGGQFGIKSPTSFLKILKFCKSKILKYHEGDLSQKSPKQNMWLLVNHIKKTLCVETNIF